MAFDDDRGLPDGMDTYIPQVHAKPQQLSRETITNLADTLTFRERFAWLIHQVGGMVTMGPDDEEDARGMDVIDERKEKGRVFQSVSKGMGS